MFCVWINSFAHEHVSLFSLFSFFPFYFILFFSDFIWFMRKKEAMAMERMRGKKEEEEAERE